MTRILPTTDLLAVLQALAADDPDHVAILGRQDSLTRGELVAAILRVAAAVAAFVPPGSAVATVLAHGPSGVAGLLGCHVAGCLVIPLSANEPAERQAMILAEAGAAALLTDQDVTHGLPTLQLADALATAPAAAAVPIDPDGPAFLHFTSGSSGRPKGIAISPRAWMVRAAEVIATLALQPEDRVMTISLPNAGSALSQATGVLLAGATLLPSDIGRDGAGATLRSAAVRRPTVLIAPPAAASLLLGLDAAPFAGLRALRCGAMGLKASELAEWRRLLPPGCVIGHTYASTEALVVACWNIPAGYVPDSPLLPVGRPLEGVICRLLDENGAEVADGEAGEAVVHRRDMAIGEWQGGRLVPGRMLPDPDRPGWRMFRTGDLLRRDGDGLWRFVGRVDRQIKINGVRIEPGEIEAVLAGTPGAGEAVVLAGGTKDSPRLLGFVVGQPALHAAVVARAREQLPRTLWPARITMLAALPRLAGGKTDIQGLLRMDAP